MTPSQPALRTLPSVDALLKLEAFRALMDSFGREPVLECVREVLAEHRKRIAGQSLRGAPDDAALATECASRLAHAARPSLTPVFNLTGTVLHTNLGRALLPGEAVQAAVGAMTRPVNLEYDLDSAGRGERDAHVEKHLVKLTGAQAGLVVNNNAAAVYLVLNALAAGREVPVSRGELVEIGGSFRIPDIMASSGCVLREVGTTNRTHARDYESAICEKTAALMKVHASNYEVRGFTADVPASKLARIAHERGLPLVEDLGSGTLIGMELLGLPHEPTPRESIAAGVDIVMFSGDKLLGGPQCGLIVGRKDLVERIRRNPMKRALRLDKVRLAALEAVLALYGDTERVISRLPTLALLKRTEADIAAQAARLLAPVQDAVGEKAEVSVAACASQVGSGALPIDTLPSAALRLSPRALAATAESLAEAFRRLPVPVICRIHDGALWFDLRCLAVAHEAEFIAQLRDLSGQSC